MLWVKRRMGRGEGNGEVCMVVARELVDAGGSRSNGVVRW